MHVRERTAERRAPQGSPDWVADWWMPASPGAPVDADLPALLAPQPPPVIEVMGRPDAAKPAAAAR